jgi:hypothetical protein
MNIRDAAPVSRLVPAPQRIVLERRSAGPGSAPRPNASGPLRVAGGAGRSILRSMVGFEYAPCARVR